MGHFFGTMDERKKSVMKKCGCLKLSESNYVPSSKMPTCHELHRNFTASGALH
jgi:hypothetical protein